MTIYLIAGPPGIGKSTHSKSLVPAGISIIDQDLAAYQYKKVGFTNYKDIASLTSNQRIREFLFNKESFALELNLGFESHYEYLRSIASFDPGNEIELILFFTDDINVCLDRAKIRHRSSTASRVGTKLSVAAVPSGKVTRKTSRHMRHVLSRVRTEP